MNAGFSQIRRQAGKVEGRRKLGACNVTSLLPIGSDCFNKLVWEGAPELEAGTVYVAGSQPVLLKSSTLEMKTGRMCPAYARCVSDSRCFPRSSRERQCMPVTFNSIKSWANRASMAMPRMKHIAHTGRTPAVSALFPSVTLTHCDSSFLGMCRKCCRCKILEIQHIWRNPCEL